MSALRRLAKEPIFSLVAILSLTLGIGINTAIFSALDALMLRPPAIRDLDRTVIVYASSPGRADGGTAFPTFQALRDRTEFLRSVLYGVSPADPIAYATVCVLLLGVGWLACYLPARHALTVNPLDVLRRE